MRKSGLIILLFVFSFVLIACGSGTSSTSSFTTEEPCVFSDVSFTDGTLHYTTNNVCEIVTVDIYDTSMNLLGTYPDTSVNFNYLLDNGSYTFVLNGYLMVSEVQTLKGTYSGGQMMIENSLKTNLLESEELNNEAFIRYLGRTSYDDALKTRTMYFSGSGFEVGFYGTELSVTLVASNTALQDQPYFVVFLDGETNPNQGETWFLFQTESTYQLVSGLEEGYHTLRIVKRNEAIDSTMAVKQLTTDGFFMNPTEEKSLKIEFIGASTMTGYGNLASKASETKTSENSNVLFAYTYLSAYYLDAEYSIIAASGWGVSRGYNTGGVLDEVRNIPNAYNYTGITDQGLVTEALPWDQESYEPDIIVIALGSNDLNSSGYSSMTSENQAAFDFQFKTDFLAFLDHIHALHPDAIIILAYGILSENTVLEAITLDIINSVTDETMVIYGCKLTPAGTNDIPYGSDYHPSVGTHLIAAKELADFIVEVTNFEIVHGVITKE
ncbi:MAG: SGNH/GDSL hydrolase family protein [Candidatus Izemoplasmatales bacterium]